MVHVNVNFQSWRSLIDIDFGATVVDFDKLSSMFNFLSVYSLILVASDLFWGCVQVNNVLREFVQIRVDRPVHQVKGAEHYREDHPAGQKFRDFKRW